jgi:hypothetical protein
VRTEFIEQASVTNVPLRILLVLVMLAIIGLVLWGMRRGWKGRQSRQSDIPAPAVSGPDDADYPVRVSGQFVGSARSGDWLDRIAVHDLGVRSRCWACVGQSGVWFDRVGAQSVFIPAQSMRNVRIDRGIAGIVREREAFVVVTWQLGGTQIDTGFRADDREDQVELLDGCMAVLAANA